MNKTAIKNFAVWARRKLISDITYKAGMLGITDSGIAEPLPISTKDLQFFDIGTKDYAEVSGNEIAQRRALVDAIKRKEKSSKTYKEAFEYIVEEVAYTWFNRLIAIRFMEVNDYLPSGIRVLSSENSAKNEPDFVTTPFDTDLEFTPFEQDKVIQLKDENKLDELFRMLFIKECNKLHEILPELFEKTDDYTELLLTISFTDKDGVVYHLVHDIEEKDFNIAEEGQVEIIGWLYQYYNTDIKAEIDRVQGVNKITKNEIPAATQIFTPDWIVRYMVENSVGRLWIEGHSNDNLKSEWKYYLDEDEQEIEVQKQRDEIRNEYKNITPEEIKVIDPCMGSGHILVYAFDVLMQIYESYGYTQRDAARSILTNNIHGLDIDTRAYQLAYFAVMMKARQYNRRILTEGITPNLFAIKESNEISNELIKFIANGDANIEKDLTTICDELYDATEYGSILNITKVNFEQLYDRMNKIKDSFYDDIFGQGYQMETAMVVLPIIKQAQTMAIKYDVVVTNPPYMGSRLMNDAMRDYLAYNYADEKIDTYAAFITKCNNMKKINGFVALMTPNTWLTINSYKKLREKVVADFGIISMLLLGKDAFHEAGVVINSFILGRNKNLKTTFANLITHDEEELKNDFDSIKKESLIYRTSKLFLDLPNTVIDPTFSDKIITVISKNKNVYSVIKSDGQTKTGDNDKYLRMLWEVNRNRIGQEKKWCLHAKGGSYRKWYGNVDCLVDWSIEARLFYKKDRVARITPEYLWYKEGITWTLISGQNNSFRLLPEGYTFNCAAPTVFTNDRTTEMYVLGLLNTKFSQLLLRKFNATVNLTIDDIGSIPYKTDERKERIVKIVEDNILLSRNDWDSFETSWDFTTHPLVRCASFSMKEMDEDRTHHITDMNYIEEAFVNWSNECYLRFTQLKENEEELNRIFIDIYGLQDELTPEVEDRDVTVRKADLQREIKSLISYAVGCMLGRYSLDAPGLAYAGGEWDNTKYSTFIPDVDNCLPITDEEYFEDDIVGRFVKFIETVYGKDTLEDNLDFIAKALGNKGNTSREVIRNYFLNDFIKDHIKIYQKRPIYWLYDSGKQNGFKALVYMHRYNADTTGNMRVEYLHRMQRVYEKELERMQEIIDNSRDNKEISAATKRKEKLQKQLKETKEYDAKVAHLALSRIGIDLDDGVKVNYEKVQTASDGTKLDILAKI